MPVDKNDQTGLVVDSAGNVKDSVTGLYLPHHVARSAGTDTREDIPDLLKRILMQKGWLDTQLFTGFYSGGVSLRRDDATLVIHTPTKGSDSSELLLAALATGEIENVGVSPVPFPQLPGLMRRQQAQSASIDLEVGGRETPTKLAKNAISRFDDNPMGVSAAIADFVFALRTFCKGVPVATVPITYDMSTWGDYGLEAIPIVAENENEGDAELFYLQVDWERRKTPIPFLLDDPSRFRPSGLPTWPYWYAAEDGAGYRWVLLHASHVIPVVPGNSISPKSLLGTSSVWICLGFILEESLVIEERVERKISAATNGLLGISGVSQSGDAIAKQIEVQNELRQLSGKYFASDYTILTSNSNKIGFTFLPLRQQDNVPPKERREYLEDTLTLAFNEPLTAVVSRGGVGFATNAREQTATTADTGIVEILSILETVFGAIFPRVTVSISRQNDPAQRLNVETLRDFGAAVRDLNLASTEPVLTSAEIRALINRDLFPIPEVNDDTVTAEATPDKDTGEVNETGDDGTDETQTDNETEVEAIARQTDEHFANVRYLFEPIVPRGADDPIPTATSSPEAVNTDTFDSDLPEYEGMLLAEPLNSEDFPQVDRSETEAESWFWMIPLFIFFNNYSARSVMPGETLELRDRLADIREIEGMNFAPPVATGEITVQRWANEIRDITERSYVHQYLMGRGGQNMMATADFNWLQNNINIAFSEIDYLAERMAAGVYSEAQIASHTQTLLGSAVQGYEAGRAAAYGIPDLPDFPGSFRLDCRGRCRCHWRHRHVFNGPRVTRIESFWELDPRARHCVSCLENNATYYPFVTEVT